VSASETGIEASLRGKRGDFFLDCHFHVPMSGVSALFGPSGCGKTTILRCFAGLDRMAGRLSVAGEIWQDDAAGEFLNAHKRPIGYVFQEASLFGHLSVRQNLRYGQRRASRDGVRPEIAEDDVIDLLGIAPLLGRMPEVLSGGERQRIAIGRALLAQPRLLLMDEPLSALDQSSRDEILLYLETLHRRLAIPILFVSHNLAEVERLADRLVLLDAGRVTASGPIAEIEADPRLPLINAPGASVILEGRICALDQAYALTEFTVSGGRLVAPGLHGAIGETRRVRVRASDVSFALSPCDASSILNCLPVRIGAISCRTNGDAQMNVVARLGHDGDGDQIIARITRKSLDQLGLCEGKQVYAQIKSVALAASGAGAGQGA